MRALRLVAAFLAAVMASTLALQAGAATDSFTVGNASAQAGRDETFTVTRISGGKGIYVLFETSDGTAHAGTDYTAVKQLLYFRASQISGTVIVHTAANPNALGQTLAFNAIIASSTGAGAAVKASGSIIEAVAPPLPIPSVAYDTSIGSGVDASGLAILPLRSGANRYYVNSSTGSDSNSCSAATNPATPKATIASGATCVTDWAANGDQLLVAQDTSYSETLPLLDSKFGNSAAYPTVFESYDPADPTNEAKLGHAANGHRPVINTGAHSTLLSCCNGPPSYIVIRGFDVNPGNVTDMGWTINYVNKLPVNYWLFENNIFRFTGVGINDSGGTRGQHIIFRKNAFYGVWSSDATHHAQSLFASGMTGLVVEDNVFWHSGWKIGASRDNDPSLGGPTMFRHSVYQQLDADATIRRNIFIDSSASGCSCRGNTTISENVFIDNPISIVAGRGDNYNTLQPNGVAIDIGYNAILGDADINSINPRGEAIWTGNGKQGSSVHNNLIVGSRNVNGMNVYAFYTDANFNQPSYMNYDSNLVYQWSTPTFYTGGSFPSEDFATFTNNIWDAPSSGTNTNSVSATLPNPLTAAALYTALGCTDKATCAAQMVETPEAGWASKIRTMLFSGYGM